MDSQKEQKPKYKGSALAKWIWRSIFFLLLLPFILIILLQFGPIQRYVVDKTTTYLSERLEADVKIESFKVSIFEGIQLGNFSIAEKGDTIIKAKSLNVALSKNLFSLTENTLSIKHINLKNPKLNLIVESDSKKINLIRLLEKLSKPSGSKTKSNFKLDIKSIDIENLDFSLDNKLSNDKLLAKVENASIKIDLVDLINNVFRVNSLVLLRPNVETINYAPSVNQPIGPPKQYNESKQLCFDLRKLAIKDGVFNNQKGFNYIKDKPYNFDANNFKLSDLQVDLKNLYYGGVDDIYGQINNISFETDNGFKVSKIEMAQFLINQEQLKLDNFKIKTKESNFEDNISLSYGDFADLKDIYNRVLIDAKLSNTAISLSEIAYFVPSFANSAIFKNNAKKIVSLSGNIKGRPNNLKGINILLEVENKISFAGDFGIRNIKDKSEALLNLNVDKLNTNVSVLKEVIPGFNPPQNFYTLGNIDFVGNFDGYLNDFVAYGKLNTDLGRADLDMKLDVKNGNEKAKYSGNIELIDFDLHKWSGGDPNLGKISLNAKIRDGQSLILKNANADLIGSIQSFQFKKYNYQNISLNGKISPKEFLGNLSSKDPNIDFDFDGSIFFSEAIPKFNFKSVIRNISPASLNLGKDFKSIKGDIFFEGEGNDINNLIGTLKSENLFIQKGDSSYVFKSLSLNSKKIDNQDNKILKFDSESTDILLEGRYNFNNIADDIKSLVKTNFPYHTRNWNIPIKEISNDQKFKFEVDIHKPKDFLGLLGVKDINLENFKGKGLVDSKNKELAIVSSLPVIAIKNNKFFNIQFILNNKANQGDLLIHVDSAFADNRKFNSVDMQYLMKADNVEFSIDSKNLIDSVQNISLKGILSPHPEGYTVSIVNNDLRFFGKRWKISNNSKVSLGKKFIDIENFVFTDGQRTVEVSDINNKGIILKASKISIESLNPFLKTKSFVFGGDLSSNIRINDIYNPSPSITGAINVPNLMINNDDYGELTIDLAKAENRPLEALISINDPSIGQAVKIAGLYDLETKNINADVKARKLPLKWLEFILKNGISNLKGYVDLDGKVFGKLSNVVIDAKAKANEGSVKINYLGETYSFHNQSFTVTDKEIDLTGAKLKDSEGNIGEITGGLKHSLFKDFYLDASIVGTNVIAINTTKFDNPVYYGLGKGDVTVDFTGPIEAPKMLINAVTKPGTKISIPIQQSRSASEKSFINFIDKENFYITKADSTIKVKGVKVEGISIEMNLTMTQDAVVYMIFDEFKNDIIRGVGNGNLKISLSNKGDFDMFGTYTISQGEYLFTAFNFVNKPFLVREGGTIRWTGDPINATINLEADYAVRTPLTNFLAEYLTTQRLNQAASVTTPVNLKLLLSNKLFNPTVKFDFEFPNLQGELKSYTDSKIRLLKNNEADYNSQVFGLIVFNSFIPANTISSVVTGNNNFIQSAGINTLSEFVSSQFSMYVTGLVNSALEDNGLISGIDFDLDLRNNTSFLGATGQNTVWPTEIEVRLKNRFRFLDERLSVNVGGNYVRQNSVVSTLNNYVIPEFFIEYALTKDRLLNLKLYGKYDLDEIDINNRQQKFGLGLRYKTEFGSIRETKTTLTKAVAKVLKKEI